MSKEREFKAYIGRDVVVFDCGDFAVLDPIGEEHKYVSQAVCRVGVKPRNV